MRVTASLYHSALRPFLELPDRAWEEFESTGRIKWASDLAEIPQKFGVTNVHAELGTSFANSAVAHPKFSAALVGTLIKGMGADHVMWGTDSVWYGSPQWRRLGKCARHSGPRMSSTRMTLPTLSGKPRVIDGAPKSASPRR